MRLKKREPIISVPALQNSVPGGIRTHDLPLRRRTLYPAELQKHLRFFPYFQGFLTLEDRALARKSSKTSNENRLIRGGCFITPITPSLELSLIFVPQSVRIERPSCFSGSSESFVKNVLRRRVLYPTELLRHGWFYD